MRNDGISCRAYRASSRYIGACTARQVGSDMHVAFGDIGIGDIVDACDVRVYNDHAISQRHRGCRHRKHHPMRHLCASVWPPKRFGIASLMANAPGITVS